MNLLKPILLEPKESLVTEVMLLGRGYPAGSPVCWRFSHSPYDAAHPCLCCLVAIPGPSPLLPPAEPSKAAPSCRPRAGVAASSPPLPPISPAPSKEWGAPALGWRLQGRSLPPACSRGPRAEQSPGCSTAARELSIEVEVTGCLANIKPRKLKRSFRIIK